MRVEHVRDYKQKVYRLEHVRGLQAESVQMRLEHAESVPIR